MRITDIRQRLQAQGAKPIHEQRVLRLWAQAKPQNSGKRRPEDILPLAVRGILPALEAELSVGEIAFLLGFSEVSAFTRAFKRWTGVSPREWRNQGEA